jgi:hypothetical protein
MNTIVQYSTVQPTLTTTPSLFDTHEIGPIRHRAIPTRLEESRQLRGHSQ